MGKWIDKTRMFELVILRWWRWSVRWFAERFLAPEKGFQVLALPPSSLVSHHQPPHLFCIQSISHKKFVLPSLQFVYLFAYSCYLNPMRQPNRFLVDMIVWVASQSIDFDFLFVGRHCPVPTPWGGIEGLICKEITDISFESMMWEAFKHYFLGLVRKIVFARFPKSICICLCKLVFDGLLKGLCVCICFRECNL